MSNLKFTSTYLGITSQCNLRCPYCFFYKNDYVITKEIIEKTIDIMVENALKQKRDSISISLFGGEPTLYPDLCKYVIDYGNEQCNKHNLTFRISLITNGMRFDEKVEEFLLHWYKVLNRVNIAFSFDGTPEVQRLTRKSLNENFDSGAAMENTLNKVKEFYDKHNIRKTYTIHSCISKTSLPYLYESFLYFYKKGIYTTWAIIVEEKWDENDCKMLDEQLDKIFNYLLEKNPAHLKTPLFGYVAKRKCFHFRQKRNCGVGKGFLHVAANGDVYPCHRLPGTRSDLKLGSILDYENLNQELLDDFCTVEYPEKCQTCAVGNCKYCKSCLFMNDDISDYYCKMVDIDNKYIDKAEKYCIEHKLI